MRHPFQSLLACPSHDNQKEDLLIAAAGPHLYAYNLSHGKLVSSWHRESTSSAAPNRASLSPQKRPNLSPTGTEVADVTPPPAHQSGKKTGHADEESGKLSFIQLAATGTGGHVVAVTDRDKCVRVFALDPNGQLTLLSERLARIDSFFAYSVAYPNSQVHAKAPQCYSHHK